MLGSILCFSCWLLHKLCQLDLHELHRYLYFISHGPVFLSQFELFKCFKYVDFLEKSQNYIVRIRRCRLFIFFFCGIDFFGNVCLFGCCSFNHARDKMDKSLLKVYASPLELLTCLDMLFHKRSLPPKRQQTLIKLLAASQV